jgi:hypothetical protein
MFIRCAYLVGKPRDGHADALRQSLLTALPMYMRFDKIVSIRLLTSQDHEDGAPDIYATLELCFQTEAELWAAFEKPFRQEFKGWFGANVMPHFDGIVRHANQTVDEHTPQSAGI